ncbi:hypothetical protein B0H14DRAFT_2942447 [Mycena olivaceomarginata]|nr:hypothetical protein B0H14DRAFT_2942447 [Mycena olivaceomarginata]
MADKPETPGPVLSAGGTAPVMSTAETLAVLTSQMAQLFSLLRPTLAPAGQPVPLPQTELPTLVVPAAQPQFQPPLLPLNSPAGASPSLRSLFPDIEPACITAVIAHELKASDLYKLDTRVKDSEPTYSLSATCAFEMNNSKHKTYKNLNSVAFPLHTYFAILTAHLPNRSASSVYFYRYLTHIATLATEYEWPAVFEYHTLFFNRRRGDWLALTTAGVAPTSGSSAPTSIPIAKPSAWRLLKVFPSDPQPLARTLAKIIILASVSPHAVMDDPTSALLLPAGRSTPSLSTPNRAPARRGLSPPRQLCYLVSATP